MQMELITTIDHYFKGEPHETNIRDFANLKDNFYLIYSTTQILRDFFNQFLRQHKFSGPNKRFIRVVNHKQRFLNFCLRQ